MGVAVITGCSTGIGYATAQRLASDGFDVVATMRDPSSCDLAGQDRIEVRALDVTVDGAPDELVAAVLAERGAIDVLVNNAGVSGNAARSRTRASTRSAGSWRRTTSAR